MNQRRGAAGLPVTRFYLGLHVGDVFYGNVGSFDRLDFTVVGPTVNFVSRLEAIAKSANCNAVCSQDVAAFLPAETTSPLGIFALQGISEEQTIFKLIVPNTGQEVRALSC